jgi:hypothetical protein
VAGDLSPIWQDRRIVLYLTRAGSVLLEGLSVGIPVPDMDWPVVFGLPATSLVGVP